MADWGQLGGGGDVEDRRGAGPLLIGGGGLGLAGVAIVLLFNFLTGGSVDLGSTLQQLQQSQAGLQPGNSSQFEGADSYETFASTVLGSTNTTWRQIFEQSNLTYRQPKLVLFRGVTQSGCGGASSQYGPHYCPTDQTIYLDETFFDELTTRLGAVESAKGDVAQAYVIAHEVGHHVQHLLGTAEGVETNEDSVKLELQADCFAGVWMHSISQQGVIQPGEIEEALAAAAAVGDDHVQKTTQGRVTPESWTHGSSADRTQWFNAGFNSGKPAACNTFR